MLIDMLGQLLLIYLFMLLLGYFLIIIKRKIIYQMNANVFQVKLIFKYLIISKIFFVIKTLTYIIIITGSFTSFIFHLGSKELSSITSITKYIRFKYNLLNISFREL